MASSKLDDAFEERFNQFLAATRRNIQLALQDASEQEIIDGHNNCDDWEIKLAAAERTKAYVKLLLAQPTPADKLNMYCNGVAQLLGRRKANGRAPGIVSILRELEPHVLKDFAGNTQAEIKPAIEVLHRDPIGYGQAEYDALLTALRLLKAQQSDKWNEPGLPGKLVALAKLLADCEEGVSAYDLEQKLNRKPSQLRSDYPSWVQWFDSWIYQPKRGIWALKQTPNYSRPKIVQVT